MFWWGVLIAFALIIAVVWIAGTVINRRVGGDMSRRGDAPIIPGLYDDDPSHH